MYICSYGCIRFLSIHILVPRPAQSNGAVPRIWIQRMDTLDDPACCIYDRFCRESLPHDHAYSPGQHSGVYTNGKEWICSYPNCRITVCTDPNRSYSFSAISSCSFVYIQSSPYSRSPTFCPPPTRKEFWRYKARMQFASYILQQVAFFIVWLMGNSPMTGSCSHVYSINNSPWFAINFG